MEIIVYGDIHGCLEEFQELRKIVPKNKMEICVGDLIDRGEYKGEVIEYVRLNGIKSVMGNHEYKHLRKFLGNDVTLDNDQLEVYSTLKKVDLEFIQNLPIFLKFDNTTILHAGINNKIFLKEEGSYKVSHLLYFRDLDENGDFLSLGHNNPNAVYWGEVYDGHEGFIIHGHQPFEDVKKFSNSLAIDTGCVYGNKLSAVYIKDTKKPWEYEIFQVPAKREYSEYIGGFRK